MKEYDVLFLFFFCYDALLIQTKKKKKSAEHVTAARHSE